MFINVYVRENWRVSGDADDALVSRAEGLAHRTGASCKHGCELRAELDLSGNTHQLRLAIRCDHKEHVAREINDQELGVLIVGERIFVCHFVDFDHIIS